MSRARVHVFIKADFGPFRRALRKLRWELALPERRAAEAAARREAEAIDRLAVTYGDGWPT